MYKHAVARKWIYNQTQIIVAEVDWDYKYEFNYPDDWDVLNSLGFSDYADAAIHSWLEKYHPTMHTWLQDRSIVWRGVQSGDSEQNDRSNRGFTVVCVALTDPDHITEFMLSWG